MSIMRVFSGFLTAPFIGALVINAGFYAIDFWGHAKLSANEAIFMLLCTSVIAYLTAMFVGMPAFLALNFFRRREWWVYGLAGIGSINAPFLLFSPMIARGEEWLMFLISKEYLVVSLAGTIAALVFWCIAIQERSAPSVSNSSAISNPSADQNAMA